MKQTFFVRSLTRWKNGAERNTAPRFPNAAAVATPNRKKLTSPSASLPTTSGRFLLPLPTASSPATPTGTTFCAASCVAPSATAAPSVSANRFFTNWWTCSPRRWAMFSPKSAPGKSKCRKPSAPRKRRLIKLWTKELKFLNTELLLTQLFVQQQKKDILLAVPRHLVSWPIPNWKIMNHKRKTLRFKKEIISSNFLWKKLWQANGVNCFPQFLKFRAN